MVVTVRLYLLNALYLTDNFCAIYYYICSIMYGCITTYVEKFPYFHNYYKLLLGLTSNNFDRLVLKLVVLERFEPGNLNFHFVGLGEKQ